MTVSEIVRIISDEAAPMDKADQAEFLNELISELESMLAAVEDEIESEQEGGD